ncbi:MAG: zinc metallopeptidase [bacterium]
MMFLLDPVFLLIISPGLLLSMLASLYTKSTFSRYSKIASRKGWTGAEAAAEMLRRNGVQGVRIEQTGGMLSDHYDPRSRTLRLSRGVFASRSLAAIGVACHEAGHALQHAQNYAPLKVRSAMVPAASFGSNAAFAFIFGGILFQSQGLFLLGACVFAAAVLFSIVTLPVEWNASTRAKQAMVSAGVVSEQERGQASQVLNAAFLTYVAAAVTAILQLLYFLMRAGIFGGDD